jgi:hypothetical protein
LIEDIDVDIDVEIVTSTEATLMTKEIVRLLSSGRADKSRSKE